MTEQIASDAVKPRDVAKSDLGWLHALNERHAVELSSLSPAGLDRLIGEAFYARVIDDQAAALLAFDQDADYDSPNFLWFKAREPRFVYIDRVVVAADHRRRGMARILYDDLLRSAHQAGFGLVVCEVNADPPNPASDAFHAAMGFTLRGEAILADRGKSVRYLGCDLGEGRD